jgi:hypothetical protein
MPQALTKASTTLLLALALTACVGARPIVTPSAADCAGLLPDRWKEGVAGADLPPDQATVGDWIAFGDAQTGRLDTANGRTRDAIEIIERCEKRERDAVRRGRSWLGRLFGGQSSPS